MKKLLAAMLMMLLCLCCIASAAEPAAYTCSPFTYRLLTDGTAEITGYTGEDVTLQIPDQLDGRTVSAIGAQAFRGNTHLSAVYIPACVGFIGEFAFSECHALISVSIGDQIAFVDTEKTLSETTFIQTVAIGMGAADHGSGLVSLSESIGTPYQPILKVRQVIEENTGRKAQGKPVINRTFACRIDQFLKSGFTLRMITTEELESLLAWEEETGIQLLYPLHKDINRGDANTWYNVDKRKRPTDAYAEDMVLTSAIQTDKNGEPVRWRKMYDSLLTVRLLNAAYYQYQYGHQAVYPTTDAPLFTPSSAAPAPDGLTIVDGAFSNCESLVAASLPENTQGNCERAFANLSYPTITVPYGTNADAACLGNYYLNNISYTQAEGLVAGADPTEYVSGDFHYRVLPDQSAMIIYCTDVNATVLVIPDELDGHRVTAISSAALRNCVKLTDIFIPAGVAKLNGGHFTGLSTLSAIHVAQDHPTLSAEGGVLFDKAGKTLLYCPESAFIGEEYKVPVGVTTIAGGAFRFSNLKAITLPDSVQTIGPLAFFWSPVLAHINIPDRVTSIGTAAFYFCRALTSISIPRGVTVIEDHLFDQCEALQSVKLPGTITRIGNMAFASCISLTDFDIPASVTSIGKQAFSSNARLTSITIPNGLEVIEPYTFIECRSLTEITIPGSVRRIGEMAFHSCRSLERIVVQPAGGNLPGIFSFLAPDRPTETEIGPLAFAECSSLTSITLPANITHIDPTAFNRTTPGPDAVFHAPSGSYVEEWCSIYGCICLNDQ